jgi:hypothetical protein
MANFPVLTEHATQIAPAKKNCSGSAPTPEHILLSMVRSKTMNNSVLSGSTYGAVDRKQAVDMTIPRAQIAVFQVAQALANALS